MKTSTSATAKGKKATGTQSSASPFDQVTDTEKKEAARLEKELASMQKEQAEVEKAVSEKEAQAMDELKSDAKIELKEFSESELKTILKKGEKDAASATKKLEEAFVSKKDGAASDLAQKALDPDFLLAA